MSHGHQIHLRAMSFTYVSPNRAVWFALLVASIGCAGCLWVAWCQFPVFAWNDIRLAPAFALRHGINPYPPLGGGPLSTWIYGPVGIIINLPATFAATPETALHVASVINALSVCLPLAIVFFCSPELRQRGWGVTGLALTLAILLVPTPNLLLQVADHSAIALGLLSCWCLARHPNPQGLRLLIAAALCALAVWSKQIAIFLLPAQIAFLLLERERVAAMRYVAWVGIFGGCFLILAAWAFGFGNLWLNLVVIPGRLPWADIPERLAMRPWALVTQIALPLLALAVLWKKKLWPARQCESGRFFHLTTLAYLAMLPVGMAGYLKIGGDTNLFHSWDYLLPGCLMAWLASDHSSSNATIRLFAVTVLSLTLHLTSLTQLPLKPYVAHFKTANQLVAAYPHGIWFPRNPVITFYADRELWHSEDGIQTRFLADYGLRQPDFRRHLPRDLQAVAYPSVVEQPFVMPLLSELSRATKIPYWTIHTRPENTPVLP
jgi:hypothetical protein